MSVTIEQIKSLRDKTGISMGAVKKALVEANGDEEKAMELLRKKGEAKAAERADRETAHGVVAFAAGPGKAAMIALGCETDFVAKNDDFVKSAQALAERLLAEGEAANLDEDLSTLGIQMGEKIAIVDKKVLEGDQISSYLHGNNRIGVLVKLSGGDDELGKDVAMHVAAMKPKYISPDQVSDEAVAKEKEIWTEQLKQEGKPENIIDNILKGKEDKFRKEWALLTQPFVKDGDKLIQDLLGDIEVEEFFRFEV